MLLDIITLIISYADIRTVLECRRLNKVIGKSLKADFFIKQWELVHNYPLNHLTLLLLLNPDKRWDWNGISENPNITWEIIKENPNKDWSWWYISRNPNITWEIIKANPNKPWNWHGISSNPNITWEIIKANPNKPWSWYGVSCNPNITWEIIKTNPNKDWNWSGVSLNKLTKPFNL